MQPIVLVKDLIRRRRDFGISRIGSISRLDRVRIPVIQVTRPLALSNAVTQGKGINYLQATISALMEALELWAGEVPCPNRINTTAAELGAKIGDLYDASTLAGAQPSWRAVQISWSQGWDLFRNEAMWVPLALVDTVYTVPAPHPDFFPRSTTGLGAGQSLYQALCKAALELLERDAVANAQRTHQFFDKTQVSPASVTNGLSAKLIKKIQEAGLLVGIWRVPAPHDLPIYCCHVMEGQGFNELAPLPGAGYACHFTHDEALAGALLEACQGRLTAIAGAREDITRNLYPIEHYRGQLAEWRDFLKAPTNVIAVPELTNEKGVDCDRSTQRLVRALRNAGAKRAIVVPLYVEPPSRIHVIRMVAPGMRLAP
ncbi:YcaO-like family protein [Microvirga sesbaniae]|uniref:YcaO-like family protein n=1 Tax=Microvirga sesbaniae TaxID=681392 RepID=UPI0021C8FA79|nr:YcaO-like family protein [Microvirga sp. HBU67692]